MIHYNTYDEVTIDVFTLGTLFLTLDPSIDSLFYARNMNPACGQREAPLCIAKAAIFVIITLSQCSDVSRVSLVTPMNL